MMSARGYALRVGAVTLSYVLLCLSMSGYGGVEVAWRLICGVALTPWYGRTPDAFAMLVAMTPQAVCVLAFSDELTTAAARRGLTAWRFGSAARWARNACLKAVLHPALAMLFGQAAGITTLVLSTGTVGGAMTEGYLPAIALTCALTPMLCLLTSTLALRTGEVEAAALVLGAHFAVLGGLAVAPEGVTETLVPLLPSARALLAWHVELGWDASSVVISLAYLLLLLALTCWLVSMALVRCDFEEGMADHVG